MQDFKREAEPIKRYRVLNRNYIVEDLCLRGRRLRDHGYLLAAQDLFHRALVLKRHSNPGFEYDVLDELGYTYVLLGRYNPARVHFQEAVSLIEKNYYSQHFKISHVLDHWALCYIAMGEFPPARLLIQQSLQIKLKCLLANDADVLETMRTAAEVDRHLGNYQEAEQTLQRAYANIVDSTLGPAEEFLYEFAQLYQAQGRWSEAADYYRRAIRIFGHRGGKNQRLASVLASFSELLGKMGKTRYSRSIAAQAREISRLSVSPPLPQDRPGQLYFESALYPTTIMQ